MVLGSSPVVVTKNNAFIKISSGLYQGSSGLLSHVEIRTLLSKIPLLGDILFKRYKMNEIVNNFFFVARDKFITEMHLAIVFVDYLLKIKKKYKNVKNWKFKIYLSK